MIQAARPSKQRFTLSAFVKTAWKQPRQLLLRKAFFQVHLWAGLLLALYIIAIGISGSILVFRYELSPRPHLEKCRPFDANACTPQRLIAAMKTASSAHPELLVSLASCPTEQEPFYEVTLHPRTEGLTSSLTVFVDPLTMEAAGEHDPENSWINTVQKFHVSLLLKSNGRQWNGAGAGLLLLLVVTGLTIWWPGVRDWQRALKVDWRRTWKRINFDLHSAIGIWSVIFVLIWAVSGVYFAWDKPFEKMIDIISPIKTAAYPESGLERFALRAAPGSAPTIDLFRVLSDGQALCPREHLEGVFFGSGRNAVLTVYMARAHLGDYAQTDFVYFNQQTGEHLLTWNRGKNQTLGDWMLWLLVPLHFGTSFGLVGKIIWCLLGLTLPLLAVTGLLMYWNRWLRKRMRL